MVLVAQTENKNYKIYIHKNKINNKIYVGQTKQSLNRRFRHNGEGYKHCVYFYSAIQKYGWDNFTHQLVYDNLTQEQANQKEKELILKYNTQNRNFGYNISQGGNNFISSEQMTEINKKRWRQGIYDNIKQSVYCIELNQTFESALKAKRQLKIDDSSILKCCKGLLNYAGIKDGIPLHWIYTKDITQQKIINLKNKKEQIKGRSIPRRCIETGVIYSSAAEAAKALNLDASSIGKCCVYKTRTCGGYHWENAW